MTVVDFAHAVAGFSEGARICGLGRLLSNNDVIDVGLDRIAAAMSVIDASDIGRTVLIPFLAHTNPMVRLSAARYLHASHRELAVPVLHDLDLTDVTGVSFLAGFFLITSGEPNKDSKNFEKHYPHRYDDTLYKEALDRFMRRTDL